MALQVAAASALLSLFLVWASMHFDWLALRAASGQRVALMAGLLAASAAIYFGALWASGLQLRQLMRRL